MIKVKKSIEKYHPASGEFQKENFPFYWLVMTSHRYSQAMEKILKKLDLDLNRYRILFSLKEEDHISISDIASHALCKLPTATKIIYRMKDAGFLDTRPMENDGRVTIVFLTPKGEALIHLVEEETAALFAQSFSGMSESQIVKVNSLLKTMYQNLPEP
ncbi:MarR family transcriptional regulator [Photorhabdus luminescens]|uniref:MarR family winged helix-turn-helix transcriptional regulator n=1 Tax=Photorhabdus akhurstii TaxID=171438 RepID=UPI000CFA653D|nr:MarR family transcriptional regulator [Photorhabdus luminescens]PQQ31426.1 MarR family transcriptional regulator [Photorhabdus luminescens]